MIPWGWLVFAFLCGVVATAYLWKKMIIWYMMHNLGWASSNLKRMYELTEKLRLKKNRR